MKIWQVKKGDKRIRCGNCLKVLKGWSTKSKHANQELLKYPDLCADCRNST